MPSVLLDWVMELPIRMQSVLMAATRGPDNFRYPGVKVINRWIRARLFHDADPTNPFIVKAGDPHPLEILEQLEHELQYTSVHYFGHLIHAIQIIGYQHPEAETRALATQLYAELCQRVLHLPPESEEGMDYRLGETIHKKDERSPGASG